MINIADNELLIRCSCPSKEHAAWLVYEPNLEKEKYPIGDDWYLSVMLDHFGFWKRVRKAFQYIFAPYSLKFGMTAELVLRDSDVDAIVDFIVRKRSQSTVAASVDEHPFDVLSTIDPNFAESFERPMPDGLAQSK